MLMVLLTVSNNFVELKESTFMQFETDILFQKSSVFEIYFIVA